LDSASPASIEPQANQEATFTMAAPQPAPTIHVSPLELKDRWEQGDRPFLLDVREPFEYDLVHLPDAVLIPLGDLPGRLDALPASTEFIVYCHHGVRSLRAVMWLRSAGFERARNLQGGIEAFAQQADGTLARY
jgi:sulfur-carrier protein adenylyltransferase/sulfurtransferase